MRLWSLHPKYLDSTGIVAVWREALLAQKVLNGQTRGYYNHPQLQRFKNTENPIAAIATYLKAIYEESSRRGYMFDLSRIGPGLLHTKIPVTNGQLAYELGHLKYKVIRRDNEACSRLKTIKDPEPHPLFRVVNGPIEPWEVMGRKNEKTF